MVRFGKIVLNLIADVVKGIVTMIAAVPSMIVKALANKDWGKIIGDTIGGAFKGVVDGLSGKAVPAEEIFKVSDTTFGFIDDALDDMKILGDAKKKLEGGRDATLAAAKAKAKDEKTIKMMNLAEAVEKGTIAGLIKHGRYGIADIGRAVQDAIHDKETGSEKKLGRMVGIGEAGLKKQDDMLAALKEPKPAGLLAAGRR